METTQTQQDSTMHAEPQKEHQWLQKLVGAASILKQALDLKANAGGEIKKRTREALKLIDDI